MYLCTYLWNSLYVYLRTISCSNSFTFCSTCMCINNFSRYLVYFIYIHYTHIHISYLLHTPAYLIYPFKYLFAVFLRIYYSRSLQNILFAKSRDRYFFGCQPLTSSTICLTLPPTRVQCFRGFYNTRQHLNEFSCMQG